MLCVVNVYRDGVWIVSSMVYVCIYLVVYCVLVYVFFFNDTATTEIYTE